MKQVVMRGGHQGNNDPVQSTWSRTSEKPLGTHGLEGTSKSKTP